MVRDKEGAIQINEPSRFTSADLGTRGQSVSASSSVQRIRPLGEVMADSRSLIPVQSEYGGLHITSKIENKERPAPKAESIHLVVNQGFHNHAGLEQSSTINESGSGEPFSQLERVTKKEEMRPCRCNNQNVIFGVKGGLR
jgi:hypothetical protein